MRIYQQDGRQIAPVQGHRAQVIDIAAHRGKQGRVTQQQMINRFRVVSIRKVAHECGVSERTVEDALRERLDWQPRRAA